MEMLGHWLCKVSVEMLGLWLWSRWNVACDLELSSSLCHRVRHRLHSLLINLSQNWKPRLFSSAYWSVVSLSLYQPITSSACICSVCVCERKREGEREREREKDSVCVCHRVCVCVHERESVWERECVCAMGDEMSILLCLCKRSGFSRDGVPQITHYYNISSILHRGLQLMLCSSQPHGGGPISDATPFTRQPVTILCKPVAPISMTYSSAGYRRVGLAAISWT